MDRSHQIKTLRILRAKAQEALESSQAYEFQHMKTELAELKAGADLIEADTQRLKTQAEEVFRKLRAWQREEGLQPIGQEPSSRDVPSDDPWMCEDDVSRNATKEREELYKSLPCGDQDIRLLRVSNLTNDEECICCDIQVHNLDDTEFEFKALSYWWGAAQTSRRTIKINGVLLSIRPNLHDFLLQFVEDKDTSWIFVDAVCINQDDKVEKSQQVSLMGDAYRNANEVLAWLGSQFATWGNEKSDLLWTDYCNFGHAIVESVGADLLQSRMIEIVHRCRPILKSGGTYLNYWDLVDSWSGEAAVTGNKRPQFCFLLDRFMDANEYFWAYFVLVVELQECMRQYLKDFFYGEYWTRLWVVPEMVLPRKLVFRVGLRKLDWRALLLFLQIRQTGLDDIDDDEFLEKREAWDDSDDVRMANDFQILELASKSERTRYETYVRLMEQKISLHQRTPRGSELLALSIFSWKRLMQPKARRRNVPFYEALISHGFQRCSIPHNVSYGLLGMSLSRLKVDYAMPLLELRVRTLMDTVDYIPENGSSGHVAMLKTMAPMFILPGLRRDYGPLAGIVIVAIATHDLLDWIVRMAVTYFEIDIDNEILFRGRATYDRYNSQITGMKKRLSELEEHGKKKDTNLDRLKIKVKTWMVLRYIELCKKFNLPLTSGHGESQGLRTYKRWKKYINDIADDVQKREFA